MAKKRHPATEKAWDWLENGEGRSRPPDNQKSIRTTLEELDEIFLGEWPTPMNPLPEDYWETAQ
jgi:hypothetical protein